MKITNPLKEDISISYMGVEYTVEAESTLKNVPEEVAHYWKGMIHNFIGIAPDGDEPKVKEEVKEIVEEEEVVKEKAPKKTSKKKVIK